MNIVFHRYGNICEPDIIEAFQFFGFHIIEEDAEITRKVIAPAERIQLIGEAILLNRPAFVFTINFFPYISDICEKLHVMYVSLSVDCPVLELFSLSVRNSCNRIFLFDYEQYLEIREENPSCIFYLPLAVNVNRWDSVLQECQGPCYDLSFVGSLYTEKSPLPGLPLSPADKELCSRLVQAQLPLPGLSLCEEGLTEPVISALQEADPGFPALPDGVMDTAPYVALHYYLGMEVSSRERIQLLNVLGSQQDFETHLFTRSDSSVLKGVVCHGGVSTHREMPLIFRRSRINLNLTIRSIQTGLSQRIWDILGCGGFLLTDYRAELPEYFEIGKELDCYESPEECLEKVRYYLTHEDVRAEIAAKGYEKVKAMHTYEIRIAHMLKLIFP